MGQIGNTILYPFDVVISTLDFLTGTDSNDNKKTRSYQIKKLAEIINVVNGGSAVAYHFSDGSNIDLTVLEKGYFFSETNIITPSTLTKLHFNNFTIENKNIAVFFQKMIASGLFKFKLSNLSNPNNFIYLTPSNTVLSTEYLSFNVATFNDLHSGNLINNADYVLSFDLASTTDPLKLDKSTYTGNAQDLDTRIDALETIPQLDKISTQTGFTLLGQVLTLNAGWAWTLSGVNYTNPALTVMPAIAFCALGKKRIEYVVPNTSNGFTAIAGAETTGTMFAPTIPNPGVYATFYIVTDNAVDTPANPNTNNTPSLEDVINVYPLTTKGFTVLESLNNTASNSGVNVQPRYVALWNLITGVTKYAQIRWENIGFNTTYQIPNKPDYSTQTFAMVSDIPAPQNSLTIDGTGTKFPTVDAVNSGLFAKVDKTVNGFAGLEADGKLISSQLPSIVISDTFVVATQVAMLAVVAQTGDVAVRTDLNKSFILKGTNSAVLADWQELLTPTSAVTTVFGRNGGIVSQTGDYNTDQITETATRVFQTPIQKTNNDATSSIQTQLNSKENTANKQNSLAVDGTGVKFVTVDAVNSGLSAKQNTITNPITGTGTTNFLPKFAATGAISNSQISDDGTTVTITNIASTSKLQVSGLNNVSNGNIEARATNEFGAGIGGALSLSGKYNDTDFVPFATIAGRKLNSTINSLSAFMQLNVINTSGLVTEMVRILSNGNFLIGTTTDNGVDRLQVSGTISSSPATLSNQVVVKSQLDTKADIASPTFTGTPTAPTATAGTNTTQIATTAFVLANVGGGFTKTGDNIQNNNTGEVFIKPLNRLAILNSSSVETAQISSNGNFTSKAINGGFLGSDGGSGMYQLAGNQIVFRSYQDGFLFEPINQSGTTGTTEFIGFKSGFNIAPTSGNRVTNVLSISGTINQTGGANGITRGLYINPTLTSAFDFRAIEVTAGKSMFQEVIANNVIRLKNYTVVTLPAGVQGDTAYVTNALSPSYLATVIGGGTVVAPVFFNGTNWVCH